MTQDEKMLAKQITKAVLGALARGEDNLAIYKAVEAALRSSDRTVQPIETAPRDGTIVDLWLTGGGRMTDQWWDDEDKSWCGLEDSMFSHWSPIPGYAMSSTEGKTL